MNLTVFNNNGLELLIDQVTGECFASISAVARMCEKNKSTIQRYVNGKSHCVAQMVLKSAEIPSKRGFKSVALLNEEQILEVVAKYNTELLKAFFKAGLRVYLHQLAGYKVTSEAVEPPEEKTDEQLNYEQEASSVSNAIRNITDNLYDNPAIAQILIDTTMNKFIQRHNLQIQANQLNQVEYKGAAQIAEEMGYKTNLSSRTRLGKFVRDSEVAHLGKREKRLCNSEMRAIWCYPDLPKVRKVIQQFFS
jgi:hypothetical protein